MKTILKLMIGVLIVSSTIACKKFLSELPRGVNIAKTTTDFRKLLDDVDNQRYSFSLSQATSFVDILSDNIYNNEAKLNTYVTTRAHIRQLYEFQKEVWVYETLADDVNWKNQYYIVSLIGTILVEIEKANDNEQAKKELIAEARVHRAYAYLNLVNIFAKHYNKSTAAQDPGVPMYTLAAYLPDLTRKPVQEVYDFIINELKEVVGDLPDSYSVFPHRPSKAAIYAILARAYLYMGEYEEAGKYADMALKVNNFLYDYNTLFTGRALVANLIGMSRLDDKEVILHKTTSKGQLLNIYNIMDTTSFNELYSDYAFTATEAIHYDLRRALKFTGLSAVTGKLTAATVTYSKTYNTWYKKDGSNSSGADNISIATPELYLIRAECNARANKLQEALDDINLIRNRRFLTGSYVSKKPSDFGNDKELVLKEVLLERRRELYGMDLRLFDMKRLGLSLTREIKGESVVIPANDPRFIFPIYEKYRELNPELLQNER